MANSKVISKISMQAAEDFLTYVNRSPSPFHAVTETIRRLKEDDFEELSEKDTKWNIKPNGKYYVTRNSSSIVAFAVGGKFKPGNGVTVIAAHTDSPCLKVKPVSTISKNKYLQVGVECYGGGLWHTWFDRDLSLAGRVIVENKESGVYESQLVRVANPILRVPTLAIHLNRTINSDGFKFNKETELVPVLATSVKAALDGSDGKTDPSNKARHHSSLVSMLAQELHCPVDCIRDFELCLYDTQDAVIGGVFREFIFSPRLDNLMMSYCSVTSLKNSLSDLASDCSTRMIALFDNEEVGSASRMGAASTLMENTMERLAEGHMHSAIAQSFMISADMAHAIHPNYSGKHELNHQPMLHSGLVIKYNANQRYATTGIGAFILRQIAGDASIPTQDFVVRQDMGCGSTIGPIVSSRLGIHTIDVGIPQLSMHSIREMCGVEDVKFSIDLFTQVYSRFNEINSKLIGKI